MVFRFCPTVFTSECLTLQRHVVTTTGRLVPRGGVTNTTTPDASHARPTLQPHHVIHADPQPLAITHHHHSETIRVALSETQPQSMCRGFVVDDPSRLAVPCRGTVPAITLTLLT
jgi:hypothetical protein